MEASWFKDRLVELRMAAGLSRKELADRAGLRSEAGIRNLEQGRRLPSWETVLALAAALGVPCDAFAQEPTGEHKPQPGRPRKGEGEASAKSKASGQKKGSKKRRSKS